MMPARRRSATSFRTPSTISGAHLDYIVGLLLELEWGGVGEKYGRDGDDSR
jgi:hypothetical protein